MKLLSLMLYTFSNSIILNRYGPTNWSFLFNFNEHLRNEVFLHMNTSGLLSIFSQYQLENVTRYAPVGRCVRTQHQNRQNLILLGTPVLRLKTTINWLLGFLVPTEVMVDQEMHHSTPHDTATNIPN